MQSRSYVGTYREQYKRMMRAFSQLRAIYEGVERSSSVVVPYNWDEIDSFADKILSFAHFKSTLANLGLSVVNHCLERIYEPCHFFVKGYRTYAAPMELTSLLVTHDL